MSAAFQFPYVAVDSRERTEIIDALYRFGAGQDLHDRTLFESAFSADATLDFTQPAARLGVSIPVFRTREGITTAVFSTIERLQTTHTITNPRITAYAGKHASLFALVEAQHILRFDQFQSLLLKNFYFVELARNANHWTVRNMRIENVWWKGEPSVLFPANE